MTDTPNAPRRGRASSIASNTLRALWRILSSVLLIMAVVVVLGIVLTLAPTNSHNIIVRNGLTAARTVAGPFQNVFAITSKRTQLVSNYGLAAVVYIAAALIIRRLPTGAHRP